MLRDGTGSKRKQTEASEELDDDVPGDPHSWMAGMAADDESSSESEDDDRQKRTRWYVPG